jgi:hypothetical protein
MLMKHIRQVDEKHQTVILAQVENEAGLFYDPLITAYTPHKT